jgi:hypothetical protein
MGDFGDGDGDGDCVWILRGKDGIGLGTGFVGEMVEAGNGFTVARLVYGGRGNIL